MSLRRRRICLSRGVRGALVDQVVEAHQPGDVEHAVVHLPALGAPRHLRRAVPRTTVGHVLEPAGPDVDPCAVGQQAPLGVIEQGLLRPSGTRPRFYRTDVRLIRGWHGAGSLSRPARRRGWQGAQLFRLRQPQPMQSARLSRRRCRCTIRSSRSCRQPADSRAQSLLVGTRSVGSVASASRIRASGMPSRWRHPDERHPAQGFAGVAALVARRCGGC